MQFCCNTACAKWTSIACFALELCMHDVKNITPGFQDICWKAMAVVGYCNRLSCASAELHKVQNVMNVKELEVIQGVSTFWSSEFLVFFELRTVTAAHLAPLMHTTCLLRQKDTRICLRVCLEAGQRSHYVGMLCNMSVIRGHTSPALYAHCTWWKTGL